MPSNRLQLWAYMESDRIANPVPREFYKERDVVMEERRMRVDSSPIGRMVEQFLATAYVAHPLSPSECWLDERIEPDFSDRSGCIPQEILCAGKYGGRRSWRAEEVLPMLEKYFGPIPAGPRPEEMSTVEPPQIAEKSVTLKEPTQPLYLEGYHKPDYRDPDDSVYDAIADIFSNGRTSRLYRSLVRDQQIAAVAEGFSGFPATSIRGSLLSLPRPIRGTRRRRCAPLSIKRLIN